MDTLAVHVQVEFEESFEGGCGLGGGERVLLEHQIHDQASEEEGGALCVEKDALYEEEGGALCVEKDAPHVGEVSCAQGAHTGGTYRGHIQEAHTGGTYRGHIQGAHTGGHIQGGTYRGHIQGGTKMTKHKEEGGEIKLTKVLIVTNGAAMFLFPHPPLPSM